MSETFRNPTKDIELLELTGGALGTEGTINVKNDLRSHDFDIKYVRGKMQIHWIYGSPPRRIVEQLRKFLAKLD